MGKPHSHSLFLIFNAICRIFSSRQRDRIRVTFLGRLHIYMQPWVPLYLTTTNNYDPAGLENSPKQVTTLGQISCFCSDE